MAQAGYTPIRLYYSTTASAAPTAGNLADGELAINTNDGKLFYKDSGGTVQTIAYKNVPISTLSGAGTGVLTALGNAANGTGGFTTIDGTATLTNKRINPRVVTAGATSGNLTINGDTTDLYVAEGLTGAITFLQPSGTPVDGQKLVIRMEDNGTGRAITWTTTSGAFRAVGIVLPTTTTASKVLYVACIYNSTDVFWDVLSTAVQA